MMTRDSLGGPVRDWRLAGGLRCRLRLQIRPWLVPLLWLGIAVPSARAAQVDVGDELARLASVHGFGVTGAAHVVDHRGRAEGDDVYRRVRQLLERFDHIILQGPDGGIERVIVLGPAMPGNALPKTLVEIGETGAESADGASITLPTVRSGSQHSVHVSLEGPGGKRLEQVLLIDTGADTLVLPRSMIALLGLDEAGLSEREVQTANGRTSARVGSLAGLWLGEQRVEDVAVAFLDDDRIGNGGLLGMSVLGRYQMTIDDAQGTLTLIRR